METYYTKYQDTINSIKNNLLKISQKREGLLNQLERDYESGYIDEVNYHRVKRSSIIDILPSYLNKYSITKEEIEYVKEYGKVINGNLSIELINDYFQNKTTLIRTICNSVIDGDKIYHMTPTELRYYLKNRILSKYEQQLTKCETIINERRNRLGNNAIYDVAYCNASKEKAKLESQKISTINYIETINEEELYQYAYNEHQVDATYYEWFKSKQSLEEQNNHNIYSSSIYNVREAKNTSSRLTQCYTLYKQSDNVLNMFMSDYLNFLEEENIDSILKNTGIKLKSYLFTSKKQRIKETKHNMYTVFYYLSTKYNIIKSYIIDVLGATQYVDRNNRVVYDLNPDKYFESYLSKEYTKIEDITIIDFIEDFLNNINRYATIKYQRLINNKTINQKQYEQVANNLTNSIINMEETISEGEQLETNYSIPSDIILPREYIDEDEEQEIFNNLLEVIKEQTDIRKRVNYLTLSLK